MEKAKLASAVRQILSRSQRNEITEYYLYRKLAAAVREKENARVLEKIASDERQHYNFWKKLTGHEIKPDRVKLWFYFLVVKVWGLTFGVKLMEKGEQSAQKLYSRLREELPEAEQILKEEEEHERKILGLLHEERLLYVGSIVLGLNDALVELTGALAGFTLAFREGRLIAAAGLITGIAASFSMAASEYLSVRTEGRGVNPLKSAVYTGLAYVATVIFLIFPYFFLANVYLALAVAFGNAALVILLFTFYLSVARDLPFGRRFAEMVGLSSGVAAITFTITFLIRRFWQIEV
jgi:VIT1/CCC1 family predicted Fe2+/Mn2+ transporter